MTSGQPGELAVLLSLAMTLLSGFAFFMSAIGKKEYYDLGVRAYRMVIVFVSLATVWLFYLFLNHDFSIEYVYSYSSTDLPMYFLFSAFWAGQEGTYLLWFFLSALFGLLIIKYGKQYKLWGMTFYTVVNLFLLIMLMVASPFKSLDGFPVEGSGLNPLLQDFWMVIHPPMMFVAYAIAAVPFALVLAAIAKRDYSNWLKISFPIIGLTSLLLLTSNAMGGYWAYKTLGWGGYWAWDPVENTSFVPWIISIALMHGMLIERKMGAFRRSNILLTISIFLLVIYGTFLTRSGVLADFSVHSFVDLGTNAVLISFIISFVLISLGLFFIRHNSDIVGKPFSYNI
ncbi:MAG: cytochrome c biogenesis protein CcsA, partial [candidate division Zixibacteria bacterium]|nr:cytochrome c biogenesis protein CcsA [candidate division Zixibacteria bacterium]